MNCIKWLSCNSSFIFSSTTYKLRNFRVSTHAFVHKHIVSSRLVLFVCHLFAIKLPHCLIFCLYTTCFRKKKKRKFSSSRLITHNSICWLFAVSCALLARIQNQQQTTSNKSRMFGIFSQQHSWVITLQFILMSGFVIGGNSGDTQQLLHFRTFSTAAKERWKKLYREKARKLNCNE